MKKESECRASRAQGKGSGELKAERPAAPVFPVIFLPGAGLLGGWERRLPGARQGGSSGLFRSGYVTKALWPLPRTAHSRALARRHSPGAV